MGPGELTFVLKPWLQALRNQVSTQHIPDAVFFRKHEALLRRIVARSAVVIAQDAEDPGHLYGYVCAEPSTIHWVYVKGVYRGMGLGRALLRAAVGGSLAIGIDAIRCSHASHLFNERRLVKRYNLVYDPYCLMGDS